MRHRSARDRVPLAAGEESSAPTLCVHRSGSRPLDSDSGRSIAEPEAWAAAPHRTAFGGRRRTELGLELPAQVVGARALAGDVIADRDTERRLLVEREPIVEARDAESVGRGNVQATARIFEAASADPADLVLQSVQDGQQKVPLGSRRVPATREVVVGGRALTALPQ